MEASSTSRTTDKKKRSRQGRVLAFDVNIREHYRTVFDELCTEIATYCKRKDFSLLRRAYIFAYRAHKNQLRRSGVPYIEHCLETARLLVEMKMDITTIAAGLLHDVVEDTGITIDEVRDTFGEEIAQLVDGVTKISELKFQSQEEQQAETFRKMLFSMAKDLRVLLIKLSDRLHNMRTIEYLPKTKARRIALETRDVYAPLANRFGIARIKWELEDLAFKTLDPAEYNRISKQISDRREEREAYIQEIVEPIKHALAKHGISAEVTGRAKSLFSIHNKMIKRNKPFEQIFDLLAIRVIVHKLDECYFVLGILHTIFTPVQERFKDYIATPKSNMYQSLHTTVIGPGGRMIEIQVRDEEMHRIAEMGIAAHWKYKEDRQHENELDRYSAWVREMIDWQNDQLDPQEYMDILKTDLFTNEVFVFTPRGDLLKLPANSTPVDFAFSVHTDIGMQCIGAKVNGRIVSLNTILNNGDSVEIITSANQRPNRDWLSFVQTSKAKTKIKHWLKETQLKESIALGEEILTKGCKRYHIKVKKGQLKQIVQEWLNIPLDKFYAQLGRGELSFRKVLEKLDPEKISAKEQPDSAGILEKFVSRARKTAKGISVQGVDNLMIRFARCCHPVPGDPIIGFISKGRGIVVHRRDCKNAINLMTDPERSIDVSWDVDGKENFLVQLKLLSDSRKAFLKDVAEALSSMDVTIVKIDMNTEDTLITSYLIIEVEDLAHLTKVMQRLYNIEGVFAVERGDNVAVAGALH
ncbi:bifunctional (p)ppGpp synthetase/guanosine-3',5'-bis(diphosphate) 3'-pyrophosphohydrolase [bacterium]|nr:bifunctional (p)ppGpp synthetase/guanosine-3',5'-bis(diphosphate) 3'-pyrophosphohydrolase [bacterium]